jgi:hypothetical protein
MATQLEDLNSMPLQMLREMRRNPGAYSRALIARTLQEREAAEQPIPRVISIDRGARPTPVEMNFAQYRKPTDRAPTDVEERPAGETPSRFRQDYQRGLSAVAPVLNEKFGSNARDAMARRDALNKLRLSLPNDGIFEYFNRQTPDRIAAPLIRSFIDQNSDVLVNDPDAYQAFVSDPAGFVQMQNRVLTPREQGDRIAPTVEAMAGPPMQMAGAEPDAGPACRRASTGTHGAGRARRAAVAAASGAGWWGSWRGGQHRRWPSRHAHGSRAAAEPGNGGDHRRPAGSDRDGCARSGGGRCWR